MQCSTQGCCRAVRPRVESQLFIEGAAVPSITAKQCGGEGQPGYLELLSLKDFQACHGDFEGLPVIVLQQVLHAAAHEIQALGPARLQ